jgi:hypothetical protein
MQEITFSVLYAFSVLTRENHILHKLGTTCDGKLDKRRKEQRKKGMQTLANYFLSGKVQIDPGL